MSSADTTKSIVYLVWILALCSTLGSLFFSEVMKLPPCVLCWYQRIAMYPIVILAPIALLTGESKIISKYILTLAIVGLLIATYHNLLYYHIIPESITPCKAGVSCTSRQIEWFGFITIPLMSLASFFAIATVLLVPKMRRKKTI
jgi:disulfide bond formation protein DsbB